MSNYSIKCPYCFKTFYDDEVCFQAETVFFNEEELDPRGDGRSRRQIERDTRFSDAEKEKQLKMYDVNRKYLRYDHRTGRYTDYWEFRDKYWQHWEQYGGPPDSMETVRGKELRSYERCVFKPEDPKEIITDADGMVIAAKDEFGKETHRRVCPHCHNSLPDEYGKTPVNFISIIGASEAGKTVFLSVLCDNIGAIMRTRYKINVIPMSEYTENYIAKNPVRQGMKLPDSTPPEKWLPPLFFHLIKQDRTSLTLVFYDIAGENCSNVEKMNGPFGKFVEHSDGMIILFSPKQIKRDKDVKIENKDTPLISEIINTIHKYYYSKKKTNTTLPTAVCISKGDEIQEAVLGKSHKLEDVRAAKDGKSFNALEYNPLNKKIVYFINEQIEQDIRTIMNGYENISFFILSALGFTPKELDEKYEVGGKKYQRTMINNEPTPKRIIEPVAWLLLNFGFIGDYSEWTCKYCKMEHIPDSNDTCPKCLRRRKDGFWNCPKCGTPNKPETQECCTCHYDPEKGTYSGFVARLREWLGKKI